MKKPSIGIIGGNGRMGQWFTKFFESKGINVLTSGTKTKLSNQSLVKKSDIVIVSVPIAKTQEVIKSIIPLLSKNQLLADLTSFKVMPTETMKESKSATLGMHPLFGPSASINQGLKIVFCRQKNNELVEFLYDLFTKSGIEIINSTAEEHDYQMAYIQAFTHAINLLYSKIIFEQKNVLKNKLHTPIFTLQSLIMGRTLHQDIELLSDIQFYNPYFLPVLEAFVEQSKKLEEIISRQDKKEFLEMFNKEIEISKNFASFSTMQTNKILSDVKDVPVNIPVKLKRSAIGKKSIVGFLGPEGTFSHLAAKTIFESNKKVAYNTLFDVFKAVENGNVDLAVVPAENSLEGTVRETLDYLIDFSLMVLGSFSMPIHQQLLSLEKDIKNITHVASHPQAIAQCKYWINANIPNARIISTNSTTSMLNNPQKRYGYIASELAAQKNKIKILSKNIEDNPNNLTKFYIIAKQKILIKHSQYHKTLIFVSVHNKVGILRDILNVFAADDINLTKLESRPSGQKMGDYYFFIEFEKSKKNIPVNETFKKLKPYCPIIRVLGKT